MALLDMIRGRVPRSSQLPNRASAADKQQIKWQMAATLEVVGVLFVLMGVTIGILTLRLGLVLAHGFLS